MKTRGGIAEQCSKGTSCDTMSSPASVAGTTSGQAPTGACRRCCRCSTRRPHLLQQHVQHAQHTQAPHLQQQPSARGGGSPQALPDGLRLPRRKGGGGQGSTCGAAPRALVRFQHQKRRQRFGQASVTSTGFPAGAHLRSIAKHGNQHAAKYPGRPGHKE